MYNYDEDIRETFNAILGKDMFFQLNDNISDYDITRLATEILRIARDRLDSDLKDKNIYKEYTKLDIIIEQLEDIIKNYV